MLALEAARREVREGRKVLLLCYNRLLAAHLAGILASDAAGLSIRTCGVYQFFDSLIRRSTLDAEFRDRQAAVQSSELYQRVYPEYAALAALEVNAPSFDCLVVDEAQDMMNRATLNVLESVLEGGLEAGRWRFFLDANNQAAVYGHFDQIAFGRLRQSGDLGILPVNCRNTKPISIETTMLTRPETFATARVDGQPVQYAWYADDGAELEQLDGLLRELKCKHAAPGSVTVLSPRNPADCCARRLEESSPGKIEAITEANVFEVASGRLHQIEWLPPSGSRGWLHN